ncbi:MAG: FAD-dependent oxidoreductase [Opitutales bacterium]
MQVNQGVDVVIVGGGVSGLACAITLKKAGINPLILEASSRTGGRIASDTISGYRIDRGFQILLSAYPEVQRFLNMDALELGRFRKGARIWTGTQWRNFFDPRSAPLSALPSIFDRSIFSVRDRLLLLKLWRDLSKKKSMESIIGSENRRTSQALSDMGFSERSIKFFFEPFLGGVFLEPKLHTSEKMFRFVMSMFINGHACLPRGGMKNIPEQLTMELGLEHIRCETEVVACEVDKGAASTSHGVTYLPKALVLAVNAQQAHQLLPERVPSIPFNHTRCLVFGARKVYTQDFLDKTLRLVADPESPIQVIASPSCVAPGYAPSEHEQIVVTLKEGKDSNASHATVMEALESIFDKSVQHWHLITEYSIPQALPRQLPADMREISHYKKLGERTWACGDYLDTRSLNGALASGRLLAERLIEELKS